MCEVPVTTPDFYPTILEMIGLPPVPYQHSDGVIFSSLLVGREGFQRRAIFWHYPHYGNQAGRPGSSIRIGKYELIEFFEDSRIELYDLENDLSERNDISGEELGLAREMRELLTEWRQQVEAKIPQPNPDWIDVYCT